jgi:hypothetical protein
MRLKHSWTMTLVIFAFIQTGIPFAAAMVVNNSHAPTDAICSGVCGVGSAIGFSRTVPGTSRHSGTVFSDIWFFSLSEPGRLVGTLFANNTINRFQLFDLNLGLVRDGVPVDPAEGFDVPNPPPYSAILQTVVAFSDLPAGDYQFDVSGRILNCDLAGQYEFQGRISALPLPATGWLFVAALLALLGWSRAGRSTRHRS